MSVYLDASVLVSLFIEDVHTPRAERLALQTTSVLFAISDLASAEFSAVASAGFRSGVLKERRSSPDLLGLRSMDGAAWL